MIDKSFVQKEIYSGFDFVEEDAYYFVPEFQQSIVVNYIDNEGILDVEGKVYIVREQDV